MEPRLIMYPDGDVGIYYDDINDQQFSPNLFLMAKNIINSIIDFINRYTICSIPNYDKTFNETFDEMKYMSDMQIVNKLKFKTCII
jgi:hypothetical protein